jgi:hypothetical protein
MITSSWSHANSHRLLSGFDDVCGKNGFEEVAAVKQHAFIHCQFLNQELGTNLQDHVCKTIFLLGVICSGHRVGSAVICMHPRLRLVPTV